MRWDGKAPEPENYGPEIWFAWFPIKTDTHKWVWLENVIREKPWHVMWHYTEINVLKR